MAALDFDACGADHDAVCQAFEVFYRGIARLSAEHRFESSSPSVSFLENQSEPASPCMSVGDQQSVPRSPSSSMETLDLIEPKDDIVKLLLKMFSTRPVRRKRVEFVLKRLCERQSWQDVMEDAAVRDIIANVRLAATASTLPTYSPLGGDTAQEDDEGPNVERTWSRFSMCCSCLRCRGVPAAERPAEALRSRRPVPLARLVAQLLARRRRPRVLGGARDRDAIHAADEVPSEGRSRSRFRSGKHGSLSEAGRRTPLNA